MIIYKATNTINGMEYIGQTTKSLNIRKRSHELKGTYFHNALNKYGKDNFIWEILCECKTKEELDEMEFHYIKQYHSHIDENGYNLTLGGTMGTYGLKRPDIKGSNNPSHRPEVKKIQREYMSSDKNPAKRPDVRKKISASKMGIKNPMYGKQSSGFRGKNHTKNTKIKMGEAQQIYIFIYLTRR